MATYNTLLKKTVEKVNKLPPEKLKEAADFIDFLLYKIEDDSINKGIASLADRSKSYEFLREEEDLYTVEDLKESYR